MSDDTRPRVTADIDVHLETLAAEIGDDRLSLDEDGRTVVYAGDDDIDQAALEAAVAAHVPPDPPPGPSTPEERLAVLEEQVRGIQQRAAQAAQSTTGGAATVANAVAGPRSA